MLKLSNADNMVMKKLRANLDTYFEGLDERWKALTLRKQHQCTLYFFTFYLLLTAGTICKVWHDTAKPESDSAIAPIENRVLKKNESAASLQDTVSTILKKKIYERR